MRFLSDFFKGIAIGSGAILPGISSGVLCVVFGLYEKLLNSVLNFFKDIKSNFTFLFPIILGGLIGIVLFGNILKYLLESFPLQTNFTFIGLILGSIPTLFKTVNNKGKFKLHYIIYFIIALILGIFMVILEKNLAITALTEAHFFYLVIVGTIMSVGVVIPGVSSTIILMLLGVYSLYLNAVSTLYLPVLIPIGIGLIIGCLLCMKLTQFLLNKYYIQTFYIIIGFTIGSIFVLFPGLSFDLNGLISILCFILGFYICDLFEK